MVRRYYRDLPEIDMHALRRWIKPSSMYRLPSKSEGLVSIENAGEPVGIVESMRLRRTDERTETDSGRRN